MLLRFAVLATALLSSSFAQSSSSTGTSTSSTAATTHTVAVGADGFNFTPNQLHANVGDIIDKMQFWEFENIDSILKTIQSPGQHSHNRAFHMKIQDRTELDFGVEQSLCQDIVPDYSKSVEEIFYVAACHIIRQRQDLYLWSDKTLMSRRTISELPSWVPEWTMESCGEAIEFARPEFSRLISPRPVIKGNALFVDGHLLDEIDEIFTIREDNVLDIVIRLEEWLKKHGKFMFGAYHGDFQKLTSQTTWVATDYLREERKRNGSQLFSISQNLPPIFAEVLRDSAVKDSHPLASRQLNIEALWSTLTALFDKRMKAPQPAWHRLFLAMLYMHPKLASSASGSVQGGLPKGFSSWIAAAVLLERTNPELWIRIFWGHFERFLKFRDTVIEDRFFVTKKGIFGCAPAEAVKKGQVVTVLGGAWVPYLLEKKEDYYRLVSHAYVEGIMDIREVPAQWKVGRIEIT